MSNLLNENIEKAMKEFGVRLINDAEYDEYISNVNAKWRSEYVRQGDFKSFDGLNLRYYNAFQPKEETSQGCIVIVHGYCGFWGKFHEIAHYFWQAGYEVFFLEQRGHGYCGKQTDDKDMVHVGDYSDYVKDVKLLMDNVILPSIGNIPCILFSHSMGGAIGTLFMEEHPGYFEGAVLSSPMFSIKTGKIPKIAVYLLRVKVKLFRQELQPFPGGKRFDGIPVFASSSTRSEVRYNYIFNQRLKDEHYHTYMFSNGWGCASFRATGKVLKNAAKVKVPVLMFTSGNDSFVNMDGAEIFKKRAACVKHIHFEEAKHELFNDTDEVRAVYFNNIFDFIKTIRL